MLFEKQIKKLTQVLRNNRTFVLFRYALTVTSHKGEPSSLHLPGVNTELAREVMGPRVDLSAE